MTNTLSGFLLLAAAAAAGLQIIRILRRPDAATDIPAWVLYTAAGVFLISGIVMAVLPGSQSDPVKPLHSQSASGRQEIGGQRSDLQEDIPLDPGWQDAGGDRYYVGEDGTVHTGWLELDGNRYYFREDGTMARGRTEVDGTVCYFASTGVQTLLVNPWNPAPEDHVPDLVDMDEDYGTPGLEIDSSCYDALKEMIDACNAESGSRAYVLSAYRSYETQQQLYDRKVQQLRQQGLDREEAEREASTVVAVPGTSEHHLGLAVDIIDTRRWSLDQGQENMKAQKWLMENSWHYGFIFRYPNDKTDVTGIIYEPWHYRYVGTELAAELHDLGLTMEEYFDSLS